MFKLINKARKNEKGFTLVELMVVVVIIGILVAIAIPLYNSVTDNAMRRAHDANVRTLMGAANTAITSHGRPATADSWGSGAITGAPTNAGTGVYAWANWVQAPFPSPPTGHTNAGTYYAVTLGTDGTVTVSPAMGTY